MAPLVVWRADRVPLGGWRRRGATLLSPAVMVFLVTHAWKSAPVQAVDRLRCPLPHLGRPTHTCTRRVPLQAAASERRSRIGRGGRRWGRRDPAAGTHSRLVGRGKAGPSGRCQRSGLRARRPRTHGCRRRRSPAHRPCGEHSHGGGDVNKSNQDSVVGLSVVQCNVDPNMADHKKKNGCRVLASMH